jgi:cobalt-precorrin 5A hydrolase
MKVALISFTKDGAATCQKIEAGLISVGYECGAFGNERFAAEAGIMPFQKGLAEWTTEQFPSNDALVFVGACGIAVRAIAPHVRDKTLDPAVTVVDEKGKYAISLLSGHLGGANDLTHEIAELIGAEPVITTATDLNQKFAVDDWAKKNRLKIGDMKLAKEISAAILEGETIGVSSDFPIDGKLPEQLVMIEQDRCGKLAGTDDLPRIGIRISISEEDRPFQKTLHLIPQTVSVGMGCRKGAAPEAVRELFDKILNEKKISAKSVERICTIDIKKDEPALKQLAEQLGVPLEVFSAKELGRLDGTFSTSEFVSRVTGVDNVCERAAVLGSRGELIAGKQALNGVTAAVAARTEKFRFG